MSLQRTVLETVQGLLVKPMTSGGADVERLRANDRPQPPQRQTFDCTYEATLLGEVPVTVIRPPAIHCAELLVHLHGGVFVAGIGSIE